MDIIKYDGMLLLKNKKILPLLIICISASVINASSVFAATEVPVVLNCKQRFLKSLKEFFVGEDISKSNFSFTEEELIGVNQFLTKPSEVELVGLNEKLLRFQNLALKRYEIGLDPSAVNAFAKLNDFRMVDGNFSAEVKIYTRDNVLVVEIPHINSKSAGSLGNVSRGLDVGMAHFFATVTKGIEYRLTLTKGITAVELIPSKVVNRKLKNMLHEFGFKMTSELPDWGEVRGFREGMGPAAEYKMELTPNARSH